jgi:hypothetical protein
MTDNFSNKNTNENKNNTSTIESINTQNNIVSFESNIVNHDPTSKFNITTNPSFITQLCKELIQELYIILLNIEFEDGDYTTDKFNPLFYWNMI